MRRNSGGFFHSDDALLSSIGVSQTASGFAVQHRRLLRRKRFCCLASAFPRQHPVLLSSIGGCCAGNDFAVYHLRFLDSIRFCSLASALSVQDTLLLSSLCVSSLSSG